MAKSDDGTGPVIIKKYANRRLYDTRSSSYITLDDLAAMVRDNVEFEVVDAKTGRDITHQILTQIIMDEEAGGTEQMLPISFLRQLISMYGHSMQAMMPHYLEASMQHFRDNQAKMRSMFDESMGAGAFARMAQSNMAMFEAAAKAFMPGLAGGTAASAGPASGSSQTHSGQSDPAASTPDDLAALKAQMAAMQQKLDDLSR